MKTFLLALGVLWSMHVNGYAGQLFSASEPFQNKYIPNGPGFHEIAEFVNTTGSTIYIKRYRVFVLVGGDNGVCVGVMITMPTAGSGLPSVPVYYWQRYATDGYPQGSGSLGANQMLEDLSPNYIALNPGDGLCMLANSIVPNGTPSFVTAWVWYTKEP